MEILKIVGSALLVAAILNTLLFTTNLVSKSYSRIEEKRTISNEIRDYGMVSKYQHQQMTGDEALIVVAKLKDKFDFYLTKQTVQDTYNMESVTHDTNYTKVKTNESNKELIKQMSDLVNLNGEDKVEMVVVPSNNGGLSSTVIVVGKPQTP